MSKNIPLSVRSHHWNRPSKILSHLDPRQRDKRFLMEDSDQTSPRSPDRSRDLKPMPQVYKNKIEREMKLRGLSDKSIAVYTTSLRLFMRRFQGRTPGKITLDEIKDYVLELIHRRQSHRYINMQLTALRFFYSAICQPSFHINDLPKLKERRRIPQVFSRDEVQMIIDNGENIKHRCMLTLLYATGMRAGELVSLKVDDVDQKQMLIFVQGKGGKQRYVPLAKKALPILNEYLRRRSRQSDYLFANESSLYGEIKGQISSEHVIKIFSKAKKSPKFQLTVLATA